METTFAESGFVKAHLIKSPLYLEDKQLWEVLLREQDEISGFFAQIGLQLVVSEDQGYAFLRQIESDGEEKVPRLVKKRKLSYDATLLLVCLRDELNRFDAATADQTQLFRSDRELHDIVAGFLRESNNQTRDSKRIDSAIEQLVSLGFLRAAGAARPDSYEVMRIIRARFGPGELETVKERLLNYASE